MTPRPEGVPESRVRAVCVRGGPRRFTRSTALIIIFNSYYFFPPCGRRCSGGWKLRAGGGGGGGEPLPPPTYSAGRGGGSAEGRGKGEYRSLLFSYIQRGSGRRRRGRRQRGGEGKGRSVAALRASPTLRPGANSSPQWRRAPAALSGRAHCLRRGQWERAAAARAANGSGAGQRAGRPRLYKRGRGAA